ncbi:MAG: glycosyltransferase family 2 protein [Eubacterium sp.]|nr:glycosyltransferase family 2 protein [Eubacterium sp.]
MEHQPLVSVVIPVYQTPEHFLRSCIESVLNQRLCSFEMILVDDGSPDHCGRICEEYAKKDDRVCVIHQKNAGVSRARNAGLERAGGKYLTFLDADDLLHADAWEKAVGAFEKTDADAVVFGWNDLTADGKIPHPVAQTVTVLPAKEAVCQIASDNFLCGGGYPWNKMWNADKIRAAYGRLTAFCESLYTYEDKLWIIQTLRKLKTVVLLPDLLYEYRFLPQSLSQSAKAWRKRQFNAYDAYDQILEELSAYHSKKAYREAVRFYFAFCFVDLKNLIPQRKYDRQRFRRTRRRLGRLSRSIRPGDLPNYKYRLAWIFFYIFGWL